MNRQANAPQPAQDELRAIREQAVGAALGMVLAARSSTRLPASPKATAGAPLTGPQTLSALMLLRELRTETAGFEPELLIDAARQLGTGWADLAPALGVGFRQAGERRCRHLPPSADAAATAGRPAGASRA